MSGTPAGYDVFLSYSRADQSEADALYRRLVDDHQLDVFIDWRKLAAGRSWQHDLESALSGCRAMVVLIGPKGIGGWQHREIQLGLDRQTGAEKTATPFPVIPVLLPGLEPDDYPLGTFLALNTWVAFEQTVDEPLPLQHLLAAIHGQPLDAPRDFASLRPYRGLLAFREQDAGLFFGRERFVAELTAKVRQRSASNLVAVLGRSGSGKSSVVFAGLFPALRQEKGAGQQAVWQILDLRPGAEPLHALIETFDPPEDGLSRARKLAAINAGVELLRQRKVTLAQLVRDRLADDPGTTRLLLYVDQWEELYTQAQPRDPKTVEDRARAADARLFIDLTLDAAANSPCTLVLSVRSDFYPDLQAHDALRAAVQECQVSLGPMTKSELTAAIEGPAKALDGSVEPELTKRLLRDIGLDPAAPGADHYDIGKLPLLEYALEQAWAKAKDGRLGLAHYAGLEQALEERANAIYERLPPDQQAAAKRLFVSLVTPGEGREDTRARITLPTDPTIERVATAYTAGDARLIVTGDGATGARSAEVSHEALIRHWERLRGWIDENRANLRIRGGLVADRDEWLKQKRDRSLLIEPGLRLEAARRLRDQPGDVETADLRDYLDASFRADARRKFRRRLALGASVTAAVAMALLAAWGWYQYTEAARRADETTAALIWARLDFAETNRPKGSATVDALWDLAGETSAVRRAFLEQLTLGRYQTDTFVSGPSSIGRAFGLRPPPDITQRLLNPLLDTIQKTSNAYQFQALAQATQTLAPTPEEAHATLSLVLDAIQKTTDNSQLQYLDQAVKALGPRLDPEQAQAALDNVLKAIQKTNNPYQLQVLTQAVETLGPRLDAEQAGAALGAVLDLIQRTTGYSQLRYLAQTAQALGPTLARTQAQSSVESILVAIRQTRNSELAAVLATVIPALGPTPQQNQAALALIIDAVRQVTNPDILRTLIQTAHVLRPTSDQSQLVLARVLKAVAETSDLDQLATLADTIRLLAGTFEPAQAETAFRAMVRLIIQLPDFDRLEPFLQAAEELGPELAPYQAQAALTALLKRVQNSSNRWTYVARIIPSLRPTYEERQVVLAAVLDNIQPHIHHKTLLASLRVTQALGPTTPQQAHDALAPFLETLSWISWETGDPRWGLPDAARALAPSLLPDQALAALSRILHAIGQPPSEWQDEFVEASQALASVLPPDHAQSALEMILAGIEGNDPYSVGSCAEVLQALGPRLTPEAAARAVEVAKVRLAKSEFPSEAEAIGRAIAIMLPLEPAKPQFYVATIVELLKWPTTAGPGATAALLEVLHDRVPGAPGKEAGLDATVQWVAATFPEIDLDSPPTPPASGSTGGAW